METKAGRFEGCRKILLDIRGFGPSHHYRGGKKEYFFAPGVGIVKTLNYYQGGICQAVYELTDWKGTGEGYFPVGDGFFRRYEAQNLTDGLVGSTEYRFAADEEGKIVLLADLCGVQEKMPAITQYGVVLGEREEERLWNEGKRKESRLRHDVNNFRLLLHFLGRPTRYRGDAAKAAAWLQHVMGLLEFLGEGQGVPRAWLGLYADSCFRAGTALFGAGRISEGYEYLDRAFDLFPRYLAIPDGEEMEVGSPMIYGGVKVVKGAGCLLLPDGPREPLPNDHLFSFQSGEMFYGMTAKIGWEWFNGVREEERFLKAIERAKQMMEQK